MLTPDFLGDLPPSIASWKPRPEVFNHNMETVPRLYKKVRGRADYQRSLDLLGPRQDARRRRRSPKAA